MDEVCPSQFNSFAPVNDNEVCPSQIGSSAPVDEVCPSQLKGVGVKPGNSIFLIFGKLRLKFTEVQS